MTRRLKLIGALQQELLYIYTKQIRSIFEYAAVVWHPGLTVTNSTSIERVQKACPATILGQTYINYSHALQVASVERPDTRREGLRLKFARKAIKSPKFKNCFFEDTKVNNMRRIKKNLKNVYTRTRRFSESTIPYLTELLNQKGFIVEPDERNI